MKTINLPSIVSPMPWKRPLSARMRVQAWMQARDDLGLGPLYEALHNFRQHSMTQSPQQGKRRRQTLGLWISGIDGEKPVRVRASVLLLRR